ncbi:MAG TPA: hypothetical protein DDY17_06305 [Syntrophaceae bacterium]|nr:hypothetical protein [Syntrophaceae bacterium]
MSVPYATRDGARSPFIRSLFSTITHRHNILWTKIIDTHTEPSYISYVRKKCLIKKNKQTNQKNIKKYKWLGSWVFTLHGRRSIDFRRHRSMKLM